MSTAFMTPSHFVTATLAFLLGGIALSQLLIDIDKQERHGNSENPPPPVA